MHVSTLTFELDSISEIAYAFGAMHGRQKVWLGKRGAWTLPARMFLWVVEKGSIFCTRTK